MEAFETPLNNIKQVMHDIEPFFNWRHKYVAEEDIRSPFYNKEYSEFEYSSTIYNHFIHPQWDDMGSTTLFVKILYVDYEEGYSVIELIGEWNDCINNDIMLLKRNIGELFINEGVTKFILIGENVLNFHSSDDCYYEEWYEEVGDGWVTMLNFREHVLEEFQRANNDYFFLAGGKFNKVNWRSLTPSQLLSHVSTLVQKRLELPSYSTTTQ